MDRTDRKYEIIILLDEKNMSDKKIYLCVTPFFPTPNNWRGAYVLDQVKAIQRNSCYDVVVFMGGGSNEKDYEIDGVKVYRYKTRELPSNLFNGFFNGYNAKSFVNKVLALGINPMNVEYVHCHVSMRAACGLALKELNPNIKVLLQHHDLDPFNLRSGVIARNSRVNIRYRAKQAIKLYNQVDLHICISETCRECLQQFPNPRKVEVYEDCKRSLALCKGLPSIQPKETYVLYNGVDCKIFKNDKKDTDKKDNIFRIGCIANFQDLKGHITLIKAFEILRHKGYNNIYLSLLGTGETRQMCEDYLKEHNLMQYVEWPNEITHDKLPEYYSSLSLFVLPSYFEGFGCVFTEAAACGIPFMGCVNQGYSEYIPEKEQDKWLIEPGDYIQLAKNIEKYMKLRYRQKLNKPYDIDILIKNYIKCLETI